MTERPADGAAVYKCPSCGGSMAFDPKAGKLKCPFCDTVLTKEELAELEKQAETAAQGDWGADAQQMKGYVCSSCGAALITEANTAATRCPYCGNNAVLPEQFAGAVRPDYVIPFHFNKEDAKQKYRDYQKKRWLLPAAFTRSSYVDEIQGVYVPFWFFSGRADGSFRIEASDEKKSRKDGQEVVTIQHYEVERAGQLAFSRVPADASKRMPDDLMDSLEPYDHSELKPFEMSYLPGFLAERFDVDDKESEKRADLRIVNTFRSEVEKTVRHDRKTIRDEQVRILGKKTEYGLLPVWLLSAKWSGNTYLFAMNGQTGKMTGDLPVDNGKKWGVTAVIFAAVLFLLHLVLKSWVIDVVLAAVAALTVYAVAVEKMRPVARKTTAERFVTGELHLRVKEDRPGRREVRTKGQTGNKK